MGFNYTSNGQEKKDYYSRDKGMICASWVEVHKLPMQEGLLPICHLEMQKVKHES
jgi:hypothetical protein